MTAAGRGPAGTKERRPIPREGDRPPHQPLALSIGMSRPQRGWSGVELSLVVGIDVGMARTELGVDAQDTGAVVTDALEAADDLGDARLLLDLLVDEPVQQRQ